MPQPCSKVVCRCVVEEHYFFSSYANGIQILEKGFRHPVWVSLFTRLWMKCIQRCIHFKHVKLHVLTYKGRLESHTCNQVSGAKANIQQEHVNSDVTRVQRPLNSNRTQVSACLRCHAEYKRKSERNRKKRNSWRKLCDGLSLKVSTKQRAIPRYSKILSQKKARQTTQDNLRKVWSKNNKLR